MPFKQLPGQLKTAVRKKHLAHALLFLGPAGCGQKEAALELAASLLACDSPQSHPDFCILEPEEGARVIKVEAVRALIARSSLKPFRAEVQVFVIDRAECMNETAQNAFLKTLEEPPGRAYFILICSSPEALLPTIRSRCQDLHFSPAPAAVVSDPKAAAARRLFADYALGRSPGPPDLGKMEREDAIALFDFLIGYLREMLLLRIGVGQILPESADRWEKEKAARDLSAEELIGKIELCAQFRERIAESANLKLALSVFWEKIRG